MERLEEMRTFVGVAEAGRITRAADRLGIAKSAVSRRLVDLEERLRVAVPLSFGLNHLGPVIAAFLRTYPGIEFDQDLNDRQVDPVAEGFDLAVRIAELEDCTLIARRPAPVRHGVGASPAYLAEQGTPHSPVELADHHCLIYTNAPIPSAWAYTDSTGQQGSEQVRARLRANSGDCLGQAAVDRHGIVLKRSFIRYRTIEERKLIPILTDFQWRKIYARGIYPRTRRLSNRVRAFVDFLATRFAGIPFWDHCLQIGNTQSIQT